jgi:hypothetical protein
MDAKYGLSNERTLEAQGVQINVRRKIIRAK